MQNPARHSEEQVTLELQGRPHPNSGAGGFGLLNKNYHPTPKNMRTMRIGRPGSCPTGRPTKVPTVGP